MLKLDCERDEIKAVSDQYGAPTLARNIADAISQIVSSTQHERDVKTFYSGIYNLAAGGETTWHGFATVIINSAKNDIQDEAVRTRSIILITSAEYPAPAARPINSKLSKDASRSRFNIKLPHWETAMSLCMADLLEAV